MNTCFLLWRTQLFKWAPLFKRSKFFHGKCDPFEKGGKERENSRIASSDSIYLFTLMVFIRNVLAVPIYYSLGPNYTPHFYKMQHPWGFSRINVVSFILSDSERLNENMPAYIAPIETTRSFSVQPAKGLRYGNFEGVVHLPPVTATTKLGEHSFSTLNNQQIYKTVCEWFEGWRPWQQRVLLCGIVDRYQVFLYFAVQLYVLGCFNPYHTG